MADATVIAAVTRAIAHLLQDAINRAGGEIARAVVRTQRPGQQEVMPAPTVTVFLFHAQPNPNLRNDDLPTWEGGRLVRRPTVALDLFYLVSFSGSEDAEKLEAQTLLGIASSALHGHPILSPMDILQAAESFGVGPAHSLAGLNQVVLTPLPLSIEDMSRLWVTFPSTPYQLSVCYRATAVLISEKVVPDPPLPVIAVNRAIAPPGAPIIAGIAPPPAGWAGGDHPVYGEALVIEGAQLAGQAVNVRLGDAILTPAAADVTPTAVTVTAEGAKLCAGLRQVWVIRDGVASLHSMVALGPRISVRDVRVQRRGGGLYHGKVVLEVEPPIRRDQSVHLQINPIEVPAARLAQARGYDFEWSPPLTRRHSTVTVAFDDVQGGTYLVRLVVDGVESALTVDPLTHQFTGPTIDIGTS